MTEDFNSDKSSLMKENDEEPLPTDMQMVNWDLKI